MRILRDRRMPVDIDYLRMLHKEAIDQLELMKTAIDATQEATGSLRDDMETMAVNHWHAYMDIMHMICMHDSAMEKAMQKYGIAMREEAETHEPQMRQRHLLLLLLLLGLLRRHRRMYDVMVVRASPMTDFMKESLTMEREHMAQLVANIDEMM